MRQRRAIALTFSAVVTLTLFATAMTWLIFGEIPTKTDRLVVASVALGPVAMICTMLGYAVWWLVLFLLCLFSNTHGTEDGP
ncbi:MAG: hypothetical protein V2B18_01700 [Pseudomonadota bacterium]